MLGNQVEVRLKDPDQYIRGTLDGQTAAGVYIVLQQGGQRVFYPQHRLVEMRDLGYHGR